MRNLVTAVPSRPAFIAIFRLPRAANGLLCALLFLFALPPAQAYDVYVAPTFVFADRNGKGGGLQDSQSQVFANVQASWAWSEEYFNDGRTYTVSNLHPEPTLSSYYTLNGVWFRLHYDYTGCPLPVPAALALLSPTTLPSKPTPFVLKALESSSTSTAPLAAPLTVKRPCPTRSHRRNAIAASVIRSIPRPGRRSRSKPITRVCPA